MKKYLPILPLSTTFISLVAYPEINPILGIITLFFSLTFSAYTIHNKHKGTEHARPKILKEVGVMVLTLIILLFLGGIAAMLANAQVGMKWGEVAGLISAIAASFAVGYLVRKGMGRFAG